MDALKSTLVLIILICAKICSAAVQNVSPKSYGLKLIPILDDEFNFLGEINITIFVNSPTSGINLDSRDLKITSLQVYHQDIQIQSFFELWPSSEILNIATEKRLESNNEYQIQIKYEGKLNDDLIGFYRSYYKVGQEKKWLAATQFEATFARMAFPCFDQPRYRATFKISVARYQHQTVLSNMPLESTSEPDSKIDQRVWDTFEITPPMPTYLVAILVSEFSSISSDNKKIRIWARENAIDNAQYILNKSQLILEQLENYSGINYSLPKLDLVALPEFKSEAMENWGLNFYRERALLCNAACSTKELQHLTATVAHELSHQWFGNYVTLESWNYTWLNEGFATYFKYFTMAEVEPSWRMDLLFNVDIVQDALAIDKVANYQHPLTANVITTDEIRYNFDVITYKKGASVLRMFEYLLSPSTFRKAIHRYLIDAINSDSVVESQDLWDALDNQVIEDDKFLPLKPSEIMKAWTTNSGYPLVTVTRKINSSTINFERAPPDAKWIVPVSFTTKKSINFDSIEPIFWSGFNSTNSVEMDLREEDWVLANKLQMGYFRVNYDLENWNLLIKQLLSNLTKIHVLNRAQLVDDVFTLAIDEKLPYAIAFSLANYLDQEKEITPWLSALKHFDKIYSRYEYTRIGPSLKEYFFNRISSYYKYIGIFPSPEDNHFVKYGRSILLPIVSKFDDINFAKEIEKIYEYFSKDLRKIPGDLKYTVYCSLLRNENVKIIWNKLWTIYLRTESACEAETILSVIGCIKDESIVESIINKLINSTDDDIHKKNHDLVLDSIFQTSNGVITILKYLDKWLGNTNGNKLISIVKMVSIYTKTADEINLLSTVIETSKARNINCEIKMLLHMAFYECVKRIVHSSLRIDELKNAIQDSSRDFQTFQSTKEISKNFSIEMNANSSSSNKDFSMHLKSIVFAGAYISLYICT